MKVADNILQKMSIVNQYLVSGSKGCIFLNSLDTGTGAP